MHVHYFQEEGGKEDLMCHAYVTPPDNIEFFLTAIFDAQKRGKHGRPSLFDAAFLAWRYRSEYAVLEMALVVRKVVIPIVAALGTVLGRYHKFKDAPEPRRR